MTQTGKYIMKKDNSLQWYWIAKASNGYVLARSSESYVNKADCRHCITLMGNSGDWPVTEE